jgi:streptogramin lyase
MGHVYSSKSKRYSITKHEKSLIVALEDQIVTIDENSKATITNNALIKSPAEALQASDRTLWIADYKNGLIRNSGPDFTSFIPEQKDTIISPRTDSIVIDQNGLSWTRLPDYLGGGILVKNSQNNEQRVLSASIGNGSLPSSSIQSLALDQDGYVWFASDKGVGYFVTDDVLNAGRVDAVLPVYGQRRLFANEKCTAIAIEPGNRKWIGTTDGLYLFSADGTELIQHFTAADSPLPADYINALRFDPEDGIIFIDTPNGMVSYRSNASASSENLSAVTIFPNPVRPGYAGIVGIKGLLDKSIVKITELSGRLIYETVAQGGTASWNLNDYTGRRARGGIYMVFIVSNDGNEKFAGKLAVIE